MMRREERAKKRKTRIGAVAADAASISAATRIDRERATAALHGILRYAKDEVMALRQPVTAHLIDLAIIALLEGEVIEVEGRRERANLSPPSISRTHRNDQLPNAYALPRCHQ
jgi:hypothetical protein